MEPWEGSTPPALAPVGKAFLRSRWWWELSSKGTPLKIGFSLLSLSRYAVYKVELLSYELLVVCPLTLDCSFDLAFRTITQDTLSRRRYYWIFKERLPLRPTARGEGRES